MTNFEDLYNMYSNRDEALYAALEGMNFEELYHECNKDLAKYYEFRCWLEDAEQYYRKEENL